jgi:2-dehydro-3-deoxygluconokinase
VTLFAAHPSAPVVDTTGAGDAFNAAYLLARLRASGVREAVVAARKLSAVVVQHPGAIIARPAMPEPGLPRARESADEAGG